MAQDTFIISVGHGAIYSFVRILSGSAVGFILLPLYARFLGTEGYGVISLMTAVATIIAIVLGQGMPAASYRLRFEHPDYKGTCELELTVLLYVILSSLLLGGLFLMFGEPLANFLVPNVPFSPIWYLVIITVICTVIVEIYLRKLQYQGLAITFGLFSLASIAAKIGAIVLFIVFFDFGVEGKFKAEALVGAATAIIAVLIMLRPLRPRHISIDRAGHALAYGILLVPHALSAVINDMIDRLIINRFLGLGETGLYALTYQVISLGTLIAISFNQAITPIYVRQMKKVEAWNTARNDQLAEHWRKVITRTVVKFAALAGAIILLISAGAREIILVVAGNGFANAWQLIPILAMGSIAWMLYLPLAQPAFFKPHGARRVFLVTLSAAIVNIVGNLIAIPLIGLEGAAWSTLASNITMALGIYMLGQRYFPLVYPMKTIFGLVAIYCLALIGIWIADSNVDHIIVRSIAKISVAILALLWASYVAKLRSLERALRMVSLVRSKTR